MVRLGYDGEMSVITDGIYVARYRACRDRDFLRAHGITHVINCAAASCDSHFRQDFSYLDLPLKDEPFSEEQIHIPLTPLSAFIPSATVFIRDCLENGGRVVVHCRKGISRSVAIVTGFLMYERGATLVQALTLIRERRKVADPNIWFIEDLKHYQFKLQVDRLNKMRAGKVNNENQQQPVLISTTVPGGKMIEENEKKQEDEDDQKQQGQQVIDQPQPQPFNLFNPVKVE